LGVNPVAVERGEAMARFRARLDAVGGAAGASPRPVRVLLLGDSHVASDFISGMARSLLQARFGDAGRGLVHADQRWGYGGRRLKRREADWDRPRVVDAKGPGKRYGLFGLALVAKRKGASVSYRVRPKDRFVELHHEGGFELTLNGKSLGRAEAADGTTVTRLEVPAGKKPSTLVVKAQRRGARLYGLGFETGQPGLLLSAIGPVGADTKVYLQLEPSSFRADLTAHEPDLIVLMVGGNDALKVRKGWRSLDAVREDHERLVALLRETVPAADLLLLGPMDAGQRKGGKVRSKPRIREVRDLQAEVAGALDLAWWDTLEAMGGAGAIKRWVKAGVMNKDLVHPGKPAADVLGALAAEAVLDWYDGGAKSTD
ncbi:MAG: GDSL-type esterase/lipase family protein, partial [Myxococcota bacterium]